MTTRTCKFGCGCLLSGWDDDARKYIEAGTGGLHTKERCQEAKAKLETKNDHGNENGRTVIYEKTSPEGLAKELKEFVDHTQGQKLKLKVLTSTEAEGLALAYNSFGESHNIKFSQYQVAGSLYTIAVFFEEIKQ